MAQEKPATVLQLPPATLVKQNRLGLRGLEGELAKLALTRGQLTSLADISLGE